MKSYWTIWVDAKSEAKTLKVYDRVISKMAVEPLDRKVEKYHKGGYKISFQLSHSSAEWSNLIFLLLATGQRIANQWIITGDIQQDASAWSNDVREPGVSSIHWQLQNNMA